MPNKTRLVLSISFLLAIGFTGARGYGTVLKPGCEQLDDLAQVREAELQQLMLTAISEHPDRIEARQKAQQILGLDDLNFSYFLALFNRRMTGSAKETIYLDDGKTDAKLTAYPAHVAPDSIRSQFKYEDFSQLKLAGYEQYAKLATLWQKKLNAGSGSSLTRSSYLKTKVAIASELGADDGEIHIGAKATDLFMNLTAPGNPSRELSIAEVQILQALYDRQKFGAYVISDVVGPETSHRMGAIWKKKFAPGSSDTSTYEQHIEKTAGMTHDAAIFQSFVPSLRADGTLTFAHTAPAGHALFAVDALRMALHPELQPAGNRGPLVGVISNGEDPNSSPDPAIVGWMVHEKIPITLITTEKTNIDKKGGLLCLVKNKETGEVYLKVLETAEAKAAGQLPLFESLGGFASTNLTLFNYDVLNEKLKGLSEDELMKVIAPDLIANAKVKSVGGSDQTFTQLEGAMGSTIMNLDRYWRKTRGEPLVYIVNVDRMHRTEMFSPIKTAFDYFMQFHSDRFAFDPVTMRLKNFRRGTLPNVTLADASTKDKFYQDVQNVLDVFHGAHIVMLDLLSVQGQVSLRDLSLEGQVNIVNDSGKLFDLAAYAKKHPALFAQNSSGHLVIKDVGVNIDANSSVTLTKLTH